ncbi:unnamed protein product [Schistosoma curassoni]|uniref:Peptidase A2 domain-containing protein n=1 Tax=Schistosoma curassoni TaxID=6186 RepID=A0A183JUW9_9TREM|nr:unnamed protein product [Schistosoma curassoni]
MCLHSVDETLAFGLSKWKYSSNVVTYAHRHQNILSFGLLPTEVAAEVSDLIDNVPASNAYDQLKQAIIQRTSLSDEKRLQQLLYEYLESLAWIVDKILEVTPCTTPYVQTISETSNDKQTLTIASLTAELGELRAHHERTVASLENKLDALQLLISNFTSRRPRSSSRGSKNRDTSKGNKIDDHICWYHRKYGDKARKCVTSCKFFKSFSSPKSVNQTMIATNVSGHAPTRVFHVLDKTSGHEFIVDTGAEISVIPLTLANKPIAKSGRYNLRAANKTEIMTFGEQSLT